jgi:hypothetical protein
MRTIDARFMISSLCFSDVETAVLFVPGLGQAAAGRAGRHPNKEMAVGFAAAAAPGPGARNTAPLH